MEIALKKFDLNAVKTFTENLKNEQNFYINYLFYFINNHYESIINNVNFFHFATESLIWEMKSGEELNNFETINLRDAKINHYNFLNKIKLLTGSTYFNESKINLSEIQLAKIFLEKFENLRKTIFITEDEINEYEFAFRKITRMTVSACLIYLLSIMNIFTNINDDYFFYNVYEELEKMENKNFGKFLKLIEAKLDSILDKDNPIILLSKMYYHYSKTTLNDYLFDLDLFFNHSNSLFEKVKKLSCDNFKQLNKKITGSRTFENVSKFYSILSQHLNESTEIIKCRIQSFKIWLNDSINNSPQFFFDKFNFSKIMLYERIISPSKDFIVLYTDKSITFLMSNLTNVENKMKSLSLFFIDKMEIFMGSLEKQINEKDLFIRFTYDEKVNYVKIDIDNSVLNVNPKKFKEYITYLYEQMKDFSNHFYEDSKAYLMDRYKLFLDKE